MGGSTKCFSIEKEGLVFRGDIATPDLQGIQDAASEHRYPKLRSGDAAWLTSEEKGNGGSEPLAHRRHGITNESFVDGWCGLDIRGDDYRMLPKVEEKGIPSPSPFGLHHVKGHAPEQVFEG